MCACLLTCRKLLYHSFNSFSVNLVDFFRSLRSLGCRFCVESLLPMFESVIFAGFLFGFWKNLKKNSKSSERGMQLFFAHNLNSGHRMCTVYASDLSCVPRNFSSRQKVNFRLWGVAGSSDCLPGQLAYRTAAKNESADESVYFVVCAISTNSKVILAHFQLGVAGKFIFMSELSSFIYKVGIWTWLFRRLALLWAFTICSRTENQMIWVLMGNRIPTFVSQRTWQNVERGAKEKP